MKAVDGSFVSFGSEPYSPASYIGIAYLSSIRQKGDIISKTPMLLYIRDGEECEELLHIQGYVTNVVTILKYILTLGSTQPSAISKHKIEKKADKKQYLDTFTDCFGFAD